MEEEVFKRTDWMVKTQIEARGIEDPAVLEAMRRVPRERFVPTGQEFEAYGDHALGIGQGQTISQPYVVAYMTASIRPKREDRVLEVGTGSGYQAAVLAEIVAEVDSVEIVPELAEAARERLQKLGYRNVNIKLGDGSSGWPEKGPFDAILVTAASPSVPESLLEQLKEGGRMIIPIGPPNAVQELTLIAKEPGGIRKEELMGVRFVPFRERGAE